MPDSSASPSDERLDDLDAAVRHNRRVVRQVILFSAATVSVILAVLAAVILAAAGGPPLVGAVLGVVLGASATAALWSAGDRSVLTAIGAEPRAEPTLARVRNLVAALAVAAGVPRPDVQLLDDPAPNVMTVGRDPAATTLVVTRGLLEQLDRLQLEGVIAHEIGHVRRGDTEVTTVAVALIGWPLLVGEGMVRRSSWLRPLGAVFMATAPVVAWGLRRVVGWRREHLADLTAIRFTRYPPALTSALAAIAEASPGPAEVPLATFPMWLVAPPAGQNARRAELARRIQTHPSIDERVEALAEL